MRKLPSQRLTKKQEIVIIFLSFDYDVPQIAVATGIAQRSVEEIIKRAKQEYNVRTAHGLVGAAFRSGDITTDMPKKNQSLVSFRVKGPKIRHQTSRFR